MNKRGLARVRSLVLNIVAGFAFMSAGAPAIAYDLSCGQDLLNTWSAQDAIDGCDSKLDVVIEPNRVAMGIIRFCPNINPFSPGAWCYDYAYPSNTPTVQTQEPKNPVNKCGSIIKVDNRVVGESVRIIGTPFSLVYFTDRSPSRKPEYTVYVPSHPYGGRIEATIDGQVTQVSLGTNQGYDFTWDGKDSNGNEVEGSTLLNLDYYRDIGGLNVSKVYIAYWRDPSYYAFLTTHELLTSYQFRIGGWNASKVGLGGWNLDAHHFFDVQKHVLYFGYGGSRQYIAQSTNALTYRIPSDDGNEVYIFNSSGKHIETRRGLAGELIYQFTYDSNGYLTTVTDAYGNQTSFSRTSGQLTQITGPYGQVTQVGTNSYGQITSITNPNNETHTITYYPNKGLMQTFQAPGAGATSFTYDTEGKLIRDTNPLNGYWDILEIVASGNNRTHQLTSALGRTTNVNIQTYPGTYYRTETTPSGYFSVYQEYSTSTQTSGNEELTRSESYSNDTRFGTYKRFISNAQSTTPQGKGIYETRSQSVTLTGSSPFDVGTYQETRTVNSKVYAMSYDGVAKQFTFVSPTGITSTRTVNSNGDTSAIQYGSQTPTSIAYDANGRVTGVAQGARSTSFGYNSTGQLANVTNALSQVTTYDYDLAGRVTKQTLPDNRFIGFTYDARGNLTSVTPPGKTAHTIVYNVLDQITSFSPAPLAPSVLSDIQYSYNLDKQLTQITRPDGQVITYNYNTTSGLPTTIVSGSSTFTQQYTQGGNLLSSTSPDNVMNSLWYESGLFKYDDVYSYSPSFFYVGRVEFNRDMQLKISDVTAKGAGSAQSNVAFSYNDDRAVTQAGDLQLVRDTQNGQIVSATLGSLTETITYNAFGELETHAVADANGSIYQLTLARDNLARVISKSETVGPNPQVTDIYTYDVSGRLIDVTRGSVSQSHYDYDTNSNRTSGHQGSISFSATYDPQDRLTSYNTFDFTYTLAGELASRTNTLTSVATTYSYDVFGNLKQVVLPTKTVSYKVDGLNRRAARLVNGSVAEYYLYYDQLRLAGLVDSNGVLRQHYVYAMKSNVPDYMIDPVNNKKYRLISDHLGSVRLVVDSSTGAIAQQITYDDFGRVISDTNPGFQPFGFAGGLYDSDTKLVRFGARDYDAEAGRWTNKDPILFAGGDTNLYGYVMQDPVNLVDPNGNFAILLPAVPAIVEGIAFVGSAVGAGWGISELINIFSKSKSLPREGPPNGSLVLPNGKGGKKQERFYDPLGNPLKDIDWGHDHGQGIPHVHDWTSPTDRGPGRPPKPGECK